MSAVTKANTLTVGLVWLLALVIGTLPGRAAQGGGPAAPAQSLPQGGGRGTPQGRGGFVAYPPRAPVDQQSLARGKALYGTNCAFCHGADTHGGDGGGPSLMRSQLSLDDQKGELIGPIILNGRGAMPKFALTADQISDIAAFIHSFPVTSRTAPSTMNILVGDPKAGEAYVKAKCVSCHSTTGDLKVFAAKLPDNKNLQQMWLMPGGGRGNAALPRPAVRVAVTLPSGERVEGELDRLDDFVVSLTLADATHRTFRTVGTKIKVDVLDPLTPHRDLLPTYTDTDIHNVTAFLASLR